MLHPQWGRCSDYVKLSSVFRWVIYLSLFFFHLISYLSISIYMILCAIRFIYVIACGARPLHNQSTCFDMTGMVTHCFHILISIVDKWHCDRCYCVCGVASNTRWLTILYVSGCLLIFHWDQSGFVITLRSRLGSLSNVGRTADILMSERGLTLSPLCPTLAGNWIMQTKSHCSICSSHQSVPAMLV